MRNRKVTVAARSKCTCAGWWRWALLDRLHGSTGLRANFGSTVMDTIRRQCHRSGQLHYLFIYAPNFSRWSARRSACNAPQEIFWNWIAFWPSAVGCLSQSVSHLFHGPAPRRSSDIPPPPRLVRSSRSHLERLIQTLASIAQLWIQHSLTVTPRSSARLFSLSINIERRSGPESGVDCRRSPPPGASANREPCLRTFPEARTPRSVLHGVNTHTLAPQTENTLIMLLVPGRDISAIGCPSAGGKRVDTVTSVYSTVGGLPILADP